MPTEKQQHYTEMLSQDFLAELSYMAGFLNARTPLRQQYLPEVLIPLQPHLNLILSKARHSLSARTQKYGLQDVLLYARIKEAAEAAADYYASILEELSIHDISILAMHHVDGLFSHMTHLDAFPNEFDPQKRRWVPENFFHGIVSGKAHRWVLSILPSTAVHHAQTVIRNVSLSPQDFLAQWKPHQTWVLISVDGQRRLIPHSQKNALDQLVQNQTPNGRWTTASSTSLAGETFDSQGYSGCSFQLRHLMKSFEKKLPDFIFEALPHLTTNKAAQMEMQQRFNRMRFRLTLSDIQERLVPWEISVESNSIDAILQTRQEKEDKTNLLPKNFSVGLSHFLNDDTVHFWLIEGENGSGKSTALSEAHQYVWSHQENSEFIAIPLDFRQIHLPSFSPTEPFLIQYLTQHYGYTRPEIDTLFQEKSIIWLIDNIDDCSDTELRWRLCLGKEESMMTSKVVFTAKPGKVSVPEKAIQQQLLPWRYHEVDTYLTKKTTQASRENTSVGGLNYRDLLGREPGLQKLISATPHSQSMVTTTSSNHANPVVLSPNLKASPALLAMLCESLPLLLQADRDQWPTSRYGLYTFYVQHVLVLSSSEQEHLKQLAMTTFREGTVFAEINEAHFSSSLVSPMIPESAATNRFAFMASRWQNYWIVEALWQARFDTTPESLWNQGHWLSEKPEVLVFLMERFSKEPDGLISAQKLWHQWVKNPSNLAEQARRNVSALLKETAFYLPEQKGHFFVNPTDGMVIRWENRLMSAKEMTRMRQNIQPLNGENMPEYVISRSNREMRVATSLNPDLETRMQLYGLLPHGAGIAEHACRYYDCGEYVNERHPIQVTARDRHLVEILRKKLFKAMWNAEKIDWDVWVPSQWGVYKDVSREIILKFNDEALEYASLKRYAEQVQYVATDNDQPVYPDLDVFLNHEKIEHTKALREDHQYWLDDDEQRESIQPSEMDIANRWINHEKRVKVAIVKLKKAMALEEAKKENPAQLQEEVVNKKEYYEAVEEQINQKAKMLKDRERKITQSACQRFALLTACYDSTKKGYDALSPEQLTDLNSPMRQGDFSGAIHQFKQWFSASYQADFLSTLSNQLRTGFHQWMKTSSLPIPTYWAKYTERAQNTIVEEFLEKNFEATAESFLRKIESTERRLWVNSLKLVWQTQGEAAFVATLSEDPLLKMAWESSPPLEKEAFLADLRQPKSNAGLEWALEDKFSQFIQYFQTWFVQQLEHCWLLCIKAGVEAYAQETGTLSVWEQLSLIEQTHFIEALGTNLLKPDCLSEVIGTQPNLFLQISDDFLERYLRLGLGVDIANANHESGLFLAIKAVIHHDNDPEKQKECYDMVAHWANAGATVNVMVKDVQNESSFEFCSLLDYLDRHDLGTSEWLTMKQALHAIHLVFESHAHGEKCLQEYVDQINQIVSTYDKKVQSAGFTSFETLIQYFSLMMQPLEIRNDRLKAIFHYPKDAGLLLLNPYDLLIILRRIQERYTNFAKRNVGTNHSSLHNAIKKSTETFIKAVELEDYIASITPKSSQKMVERPSLFSSSGSFYSSTGRAPSVSVEDRLQLREKNSFLTQEAAEAKKETSVAKQETAEAKQKVAEAKQKAAEAQKETSDAKQETAEAKRLLEEQERQNKAKMEKMTKILLDSGISPDVLEDATLDENSGHSTPERQDSTVRSTNNTAAVINPLASSSSVRLSSVTHSTHFGSSGSHLSVRLTNIPEEVPQNALGDALDGEQKIDYNNATI